MERSTDMFDERYVDSAIDALRGRGVEFGPGLSDSALAAVARAFGCQFPPELKMFLGTAVPRGSGWTDWTRDANEIVAESREHVARAFTFDVREGQYWLDQFGPRPDDAEVAVRLAVSAVAEWPPLIPVYGHRFMPSKPEGPGNPVLSVYQAVDSIYYGLDFADYLANEFDIPRPSWAGQHRREVPVWSEAFDL